MHLAEGVQINLTESLEERQSRGARCIIHHYAFFGSLFVLKDKQAHPAPTDGRNLSPEAPTVATRPRGPCTIGHTLMHHPRGATTALGYIDRRTVDPEVYGGSSGSAAYRQGIRLGQRRAAPRLRS